MVQHTPTLGLQVLYQSKNNQMVDVKALRAPKVELKVRPKPSRPQKKIYQTCTLFNQPSEIILSISQFLSPSSRAAFALSCKTAYTLVGPRSGKKFEMRHIERRNVLHLLERDPTIGGHLYCCDRCSILHHFDARWTRSPELMEAQLCSGWSFRPMGSSLRVEYHHARLVMNQHLFGASSGLPLESLALSTSSSRSRVTLVQKRSARIINDLLYIKCEHQVVPRRPTTDPDIFYRLVYAFSLNICHHQETDHVHTISPEILSFASKHMGLDGEAGAYKGTRGACKRCPTDYETTVQIEDVNEKGQQSLTATVVSYHLLGSCRTEPNSECYGLFTVGWPNEMDQLYWRDVGGYPGGSIHQKWDESC